MPVNPLQIRLLKKKWSQLDIISTRSQKLNHIIAKKKKKKKLYLFPKLTVVKMYTLGSEREGNKPVSIFVYRQLFNSFEPPLAVYEPKKGRCILYLQWADCGLSPNMQQKEIWRHRNSEIAAFIMQAANKKSA